ncbi:MAG: hypothetical protein Pg6A_04930 [Termitinemataceae bacterium]|nr:MAG: hypothetical protein Pg6A_04930 [Termitinemataceae bacterium]
MSKKCRIFIAFFIITLLNTTVLFARGGIDPVLSQADKLAKEKKYNEALRILTEFIRSDDIRFDSAQERVRKILKIYDDYDKLVNKLINVVEKNPEDYENIVQIANELRKINAPYNEETRRFVNRIQEVARFTINRERIENILRQGRELLDREDYIGALKKYREGFEIFDYELHDSGFKTDLIKKTDATVAGIDKAITGAAEVSPVMKNAGQTLNAANGNRSLSFKRQTAEQTTKSIMPRLDSLIKIKEDIAKAHDYFELTGDLPEIEGSEKLGRFYYPAAALFLRGRAASDKREGILGAIDGIWQSAAVPLDRLVTGIAERLYAESLNPAEEGNYPLAGTNIAAAREFLHRPNIIDLIEPKSSRFESFDDAPAFFLPKIPFNIKDSVTRLKTMDSALLHFSEAGDIGSRFSALSRRANNLNFDDLTQKKLSNEQFYKEFIEIQNGISALNSETEKRLAAIENEKLALAPLKNEPPLIDKKETNAGATLRYMDDSSRIMSALGQKIASAELVQSEKLYLAVNSKLKSDLDDIEKRYAEGTRLLEGVIIKTEGDEQITAKYSREAGAVFKNVAGTIQNNIDIGERTLDAYNEDSKKTELSGLLKPYDKETADYIKRMRELESGVKRDLALAQERAQRSESLRIDGDRLLSESRRALNAEDFDLSREKLRNSVSRFVESLELQENPALRRRWGSELEPLAAEITHLEYEYVVREVRKLIDSSRDRYYAGVFDRAEESLVRAQSRWAKVDETPNDEIVYWLGLVRGALSLRSGMNVPITAPLYPEISQLLSDAKKNYREGVSLLETKREAGMIKFAEAKEKTQTIKLMFPVNQEAGILELRIDKIIDPKAFETSFRQRFVTAVAGTKRGEKGPYFELENLAAINPEYPGIDAALLEAKYDVGILERPIDRNVQTESAGFVEQARRVLSQGGAKRGGYKACASRAAP